MRDRAGPAPLPRGPDDNNQSRRLSEPYPAGGSADRFQYSLQSPTEANSLLTTTKKSHECEEMIQLNTIVISYIEYFRIYILHTSL